LNGAISISELVVFTRVYQVDYWNLHLADSSELISGLLLR